MLAEADHLVATLDGLLGLALRLYQLPQLGQRPSRARVQVVADELAHQLQLCHRRDRLEGRHAARGSG
eukprot:15338304-Alexandrium_andersonii.AAC.1